MTKSKPRVGRPRLANPSLKTLRNRASAANANLKRALPQLVTNAKARNQKRVKNRQRAEKNPPPEVIVRSLLAKHAGKSTWKQFIDTKQDISDDQHLGIYRNKVTRLAKSLRANVGGVVFTRRSSRLDPWKAIPLYLQIANRDHLHHEGTYKRSINIFIDGCEVACYKPAGVVTLSLTLPTLRVPHQVSAVLRLCHWMGTEEPNELKLRLRNLKLKEVLTDAQKGAFDGHRYRITMNLDWSLLTKILCWEQSGHEKACWACVALRRHWMYCDYMKQPQRPLESFFGGVLGFFLSLFETIDDIIYDVVHCLALVLRNMLLHALDIWVQDMSAKYPHLVDPGLLGRLRDVYNKHLERCPYRPPDKRGPEYKGWSPGGNMSKEQILYNDKFWDDLCAVLPTAAHGLDFGAKHPGVPSESPLQWYCRELRRLCVQMCAWKPEGVERRTADCDRLHRVYQALGLPTERITVQCHFFLAHYEPRLRRHANLQGGSSEGGEHAHQTVHRIVAVRKSKPNHKCPEGMKEFGRDAALDLALWAEGEIHLENDCDHAIALPSMSLQQLLLVLCCVALFVQGSPRQIYRAAHLIVGLGK